MGKEVFPLNPTEKVSVNHNNIPSSKGNLKHTFLQELYSIKPILTKLPEEVKPTILSDHIASKAVEDKNQVKHAQEVKAILSDPEIHICL